MLGNRIKSLRKEHDMNQTELGQKIGVGRTTITEYEAGRIQPPYDKLQAMAKLFGVSVKYLTGEANSKIDAANDIKDLCKQINQMIDLLEQKDVIVNFDGHPMTNDAIQVASEQLKQTVRLCTLMNSLNTDEQ